MRYGFEIIFHLRSSPKFTNPFSYADFSMSQQGGAQISDLTNFFITLCSYVLFSFSPPFDRNWPFKTKQPTTGAGFALHSLAACPHLRLATKWAARSMLP
jgi:hypothetical protein